MYKLAICYMQWTVLKNIATLVELIYITIIV